MGADAIEPDIVATRDGVLVVRHENEISGTTDVAYRTEFLDRRTTKSVDGEVLTGWFTEDFTWAEISTLRCRERLPSIRRTSSGFDDRFPILRLSDVITFAGEGRGTGEALRLIMELKHATYFESLGLPLHELLLEEFAIAGRQPSEDWITFESFEKTCLARLRSQGTAGRRVYLAQQGGAPFDSIWTHGSDAATYADELSPQGLEVLAGSHSPLEVGDASRPLHGISVEKPLIVDDPRAGRALVDASHSVGLDVYCWTLRPENQFLSSRFRTDGSAGFGDWASEMRCALDAGVDGMFVDYPDLAVDIRNRWSRVEP